MQGRPTSPSDGGGALKSLRNVREAVKGPPGAPREITGPPLRPTVPQPPWSPHILSLAPLRSAGQPLETLAIKAKMKELKPLVMPGLRGLLKGMKLDTDASNLFDKFAVQKQTVPSGNVRLHPPKKRARVLGRHTGRLAEPLSR